ncbi:MAG: hypothetical protein O3B01_10515 [Planctomycetota bacterium]|nr:hypothetical protein [Planctomycetota bacterium]MDA1139004.1 hypothetical protein [Planctomycetota bacterium]
MSAPLKPNAHNPDELLHGFTRTSTTSFVILAIVIHAVLVMGTSYPYIRDTYIAPEEAALRKEEAEREKKEKLKAERDAAVQRAEGTGAKESGKAEDGKEKPKTSEGDKGEKDTQSTTTDGDKKQPKVIKEITEKAKPDEIPRQPDDIGISIDDTN